MLSLTVLGTVMLVASQEICYLPLDVMFLQDTTGSFIDDLPQVEAQIPMIVDALLNRHPESRFGVAEFKDKPYFPLGESNDFCYKLGDGKLSADMSDFQWAYSLLYASGGADLPEATHQALIDIAYDANVGWRPIADAGRAAVANEAGARLVILSTDAVPHLPNDISKYKVEEYPDLPQNLSINSGSISTDDLNFECLFQDYPSAEQMAAAIKAMNIHLVILTPEDAAIVPAWRWVNDELLGQPSDYYQFIESDSSDLLEALLLAVEAVTRTACIDVPTINPTPFPTFASLAPVTQGTFPIATPPTANDVCPPCDGCSGCQCNVACPCNCEPCKCPEGIVLKISGDPDSVYLNLH